MSENQNERKTLSQNSNYSEKTLLLPAISGRSKAFLFLDFFKMFFYQSLEILLIQMSRLQHITEIQILLQKIVESQKRSLISGNFGFQQLFSQILFVNSIFLGIPIRWEIYSPIFYGCSIYFCGSVILLSAINSLTYSQ